MKLTPKRIADFQAKVWAYYDQHGRNMPWRVDTSLYAVLVSEIMLQQTQVSRVIPKFEAFIHRFPTLESLAEAPLADVLIMWQGLGYNRRAKYLHDAAKYIVANGEPRTLSGLIALPGIGANTAGAIMAYVYNQPVVFVETNIRTVYIHEFFADRHNVTDQEIREHVDATCDRENPREWYWALMDYGVYLKRTDARLSQSKHYRKQPLLRGSVREMRGKIITRLSKGDQGYTELQTYYDDARFETALQGLIHDKLVTRHGDQIGLTGSRETS